LTKENETEVIIETVLCNHNHATGRGKGEREGGGKRELLFIDVNHT